MKKTFLLLLVLLAVAASAEAQSTTVSGQVTDTDGQAWNNGTFVFTFVTNPNYPIFSNYSWTGGTLPFTVSGSMNATGGYSVSVPSNSAITPINSQWSLKVCPQGSGSCVTIANTTITGATQTVNVTPSGIRINLSSATPPVSAYADAEIVGAIIGSQYYNLTTTGNRVCQAVTGSTCTTWNSAGGVSPNSPVPANQAQGPTYNVRNYGAIGDAKKTTTAVTTNGSASVTDATSTPWLSTDVGKRIFCIGNGGNTALTVTIATIATFVNSGSITVNTTGTANAQSSSVCVWFTQKDTAAFQAANAAALQPLTSIITSSGPTLSQPGNIFCPKGGYVVDSPFFVQVGASGNTLGVSFIGESRSSCIIYVSPDVVTVSGSYIMATVSTDGAVFSDFTVDCSRANINTAGAGFRFNSYNTGTIKNLAVYGCANGGSGGLGLFQWNAITDVLIDNIRLNNTSSPAGDSPFVLTAGNAVHIRNWYTTNPSGFPSFITSSGSINSAGGPRSVTQAGVIIEDSVFDEGANPGMLTLNNSNVTVIGSSFFDGTATGITLDGFSSLFITNSHIAPFGGACSGGNRNALTLVSGSNVYATGNTFESCGTGAAVSGPAGALFADLGGNEFRVCPGGTPCPLVTAATYASAFAGGVIPKATVTHTPNTCYAVTGNLLATAQNICTFLNDQNYQVLNITAQSGGTTPTNSSCATPPVITLSDGTRTATLTMTTGKTQWSSAVDASTVNSVFATGTTLTISIGANTCATPPVNVAVSYVLQSVLNP